MINKLKSLLSGATPAARLSEMDYDEQVAVCAILLEVAESDFEVAPEESELIITMLASHFSLADHEVRELLGQTIAEREQVPDLWSFTNSISRDFSPEKKLGLLVMVWRVILADGKLDPYEEQLASKLQTMLAVNRSVLMQAKQLAREKEE